MLYTCVWALYALRCPNASWSSSTHCSATVRFVRTSAEDTTACGTVLVCSYCRRAAVLGMSDDGSSARRWEARARVEYPLHYLIWLREHKLLEEKLEAINANVDTVSAEPVNILLHPPRAAVKTRPGQEFKNEGNPSALCCANYIKGAIYIIYLCDGFSFFFFLSRYLLLFKSYLISWFLGKIHTNYLEIIGWEHFETEYISQEKCH